MNDGKDILVDHYQLTLQATMGPLLRFINLVLEYERAHCGACKV